MIYSINKQYILDEFEKKRIIIEFEFKAEKDDLFQLFFRDSITGFKEQNSERANINGSKEFQKLKFSIPDTINLHQVRFDIGNNYHTEPVELRSIDITYNGFHESITSDSILKYFRANTFIEEISGNTFKRKIINNKSDPILISKNLSPLILSLRSKTNYKRIAINLIVSLILSLSALLAFKEHNRQTNISITFNEFFVVIFLLILILPFLDSVFSLDGFTIKEKRKLAPQKQFTYENINNYPTDFENYFNDHFGLRSAMISTGGVLKAKMFRTSPKEDKILVGKNEWLFYWDYNSKNSFYNSNPFKNENLGSLGPMLKKASDKSKTLNASLVVSIYPNKSDVYLDKIPSRFMKGKNNESDRAKQLALFLNKNNIPYIGHNKILSSKQDLEFTLYHKNDSHWNSLGAFIAYQELISQMRQIQKEIEEPLALKDFNISLREDYLQGDLLDIMGVDNRLGFFSDSKIRLIPKTASNVSLSTSIIDEKKSRILHNPKCNNELTLLIFGDSFTFELLNFIGYHFKEVVFVRGFKIESKLIEHYEPDIVLYGIVKRNLENFKS